MSGMSQKLPDSINKGLYINCKKNKKNFKNVLTKED